MHGGEAPAHSQSYSVHRVRFLFTPRRMTWGNAKRVVDAFEAIIDNDGWTYASHVTVEDSHIGIVGFLSMAYRSQVLTSLSSKDTAAAESRARSARAHNMAIVHELNSTVSSTRPESPHAYVVPGSQISIVCAAYGDDLPHRIVFQLLMEAQFITSMAVRVHGPFAIVGADDFKTQRFGNVVVGLEPGAQLTWFRLLIAWEAVTEFFSSFGTFALTFNIRWDGVRDLGFGHVRPLEEGEGDRSDG